MDLTNILILIYQKYGAPVTVVVMFTGYLAWKQLKISEKKRSGEWVSWKVVDRIDKEVIEMKNSLSKIEPKVEDNKNRIEKLEEEKHLIWIKIGEIVPESGNHLKRIESLESDSKDFAFAISENKSSIENLRIVSEENIKYMREMMAEIREDIRYLRGKK